MRPLTWWAAEVGTLADGCWRHSSGTLRLLPPPEASGAGVAVVVAVAVAVAVAAAGPVGRAGST